MKKDGDDHFQKTKDGENGKDDEVNEILEILKMGKRWRLPFLGKKMEKKEK